MQKYNRITALLVTVFMLLCMVSCGAEPADPGKRKTTKKTNNNSSAVSDELSDPVSDDISDEISDPVSGDVSDDSSAPDDFTDNEEDNETSYTSSDTVEDKNAMMNEMVSIWTVDSLTDVFADTSEPSEPKQSIQLEMARNEYESGQIVIRSLEELDNVRITFEYGQKGCPVLTAQPINYVTCGKSREGGMYSGPAKYDRAALGDQNYPVNFPEYYSNSDTLMHLNADETVSFVIEAHTTAATAAGLYSANAVITTSLGFKKIPVRIRVYDVTLPTGKDSKFINSCWSELNINEAMIRSWYGIELYSDDYWKLIGEFARIQKKERINSLFVPLLALLQSDMSIAPDGTYQFTFKNLDKYIETFLAGGDYQVIEGAHLVGKDWSGKFSPDKENSAGVVTVFQGTGTDITTTELQYSDPAAQKHLRQLLTALNAHLKAKGWDKMWIQHGLDECYNLDSQIPQAIETAKLINELMPNSRTVDAGSVYSVMAEYNLPCPRIDFYEAEKAKYDKLNTTGAVDLWLYADTGARGDILYRAQDYPLISTRAIGWYCFRNQAKGYLHWAWNLWAWTGLDPFSEMANQDGATDTYIVYPDMNDLTVMETTRSTAVRDGFEDYELLVLAQQKNPTKTQSIINELIVDQHRFQRSTTEFAELRSKLLKFFA